MIKKGDCQELLPPTRGNEGDIEAEDEGERDESEEGVKISHNALKKPEENTAVPGLLFQNFKSVTFFAQDSSPPYKLPRE